MSNDVDGYKSPAKGFQKMYIPATCYVKTASLIHVIHTNKVSKVNILLDYFLFWHVPVTMDHNLWIQLPTVCNPVGKPVLVCS